MSLESKLRETLLSALQWDASIYCYSGKLDGDTTVVPLTVSLGEVREWSSHFLPRDNPRLYITLTPPSSSSASPSPPCLPLQSSTTYIRVCVYATPRGAMSAGGRAGAATTTTTTTTTPLLDHVVHVDQLAGWKQQEVYLDTDNSRVMKAFFGANKQLTYECRMAEGDPALQTPIASGNDSDEESASPPATTAAAAAAAEQPEPPAPTIAELLQIRMHVSVADIIDSCQPPQYA